MSIESRLEKVEAAVGTSDGFMFVLLPSGMSDAEESEWIAKNCPLLEGVTHIFWRGLLTKRYSFDFTPQDPGRSGAMGQFE